MSEKGICKVESCGKDARTKGYCARHYRSWKKGKLGKPRYRTCVEEGCRKARFRRSLCLEHFNKAHAKAAPSEQPPAPAA
jgi:hypothetical protein